MSATLAPPPPQGMAAGAAISVAAHLGLVAALAMAVQWRLPAPQPVAAELWSAVPQSAAPPAPATAPPPEPAATPPATPAPAPAATAEPAAAAAKAAEAAALQAARDAEIAREREVQRRAQEQRAAREKAAQEKAAQEQAARTERQRLERERAQQRKAEEAEKAEKAEKARLQKAERQKAERQKAEQQTAEQRKAEEARLARQREENLRRLMGQIPAGSGAAAGSASADAAPSAAYAGRLVQAIFPNIVFTDTLPGNPAAVVEVRAGPNGTVIGRRLVSSSGHREWDEAVLRAIDRTGTLPRDADGRVPPVIEITFRPR